MNLINTNRRPTNIRGNLQTALFNLLNPIRQYLTEFEIPNAEFAHLICRIIPAQCPFERNFSLFGRISIHIPPLCKFNPLYEEVVGLRFRALCYLADECNENIHCYL
ncbi:MAG: Mo-dependent nitrogenase C-terminal domain-containing protein [Cyanobacteriota bacterium]|nr:Mo-dependent nitrogenase C-terminal domain-containing protein [Cyanobacteriota bacterium]